MSFRFKLSIVFVIFSLFYIDISYSFARESSERSFDTYLLLRIEGLKEALKENKELQAVRLIRYWVAKTVNSCSGEGCSELSPMGRNLSIQEELRLFDQNKMGHLCGGISVFSSRVYSLFGFPNATLNVGVEIGGLTHVFNLVQIMHGGKPFIVVEDSTSNTEYGIKGKEITHFIDLIIDIRNGARNSTKIDYYPNAVRNRIVAKNGIIKETGKVKMFPISKWFYNVRKVRARNYLAKYLGTTTEMITPYHMMLRHINHKIFLDSPTINSTLNEYLRIVREFEE